MTEWYPVMLNISGRLCVLFGGGAVAERKAGGLLAAGARVRIVSPRLTETLYRLAEAGKIEWLAREAAESDLEGAALAFAATGSREINRRMVQSAKERGIPVNAADAGETGDFLLPAVLRRGQFVLTASISGAGPALASRVIRDLADRYGPEFADYADILGRIRRMVKQQVEDPAERRKLLQAAADPEKLEEWRSGDWTKDPQKVLDQLKDRAAAEEQHEDIS